MFVKALEVLFILHADHEQNCSTNAVRAVGSSHVDPFSADRRRHRRALRPAARRRQRAVLHMIKEIGDKKNIPAFIEGVKGGKGQKLMGFGHRVYKSYDPRARIVKKLADDVFAQIGVDKDLEIALELERIALSDDYFVSRKLYPNVDFYTGLIYRSMAFPTDFFTVLFAVARTAGLARAVGGDAHRQGAEDRPPAPDLHRLRRAAVRVVARLRSPRREEGRRPAMRTLVTGFALIALAACGGDSSTAKPSDSVTGTWTLQTYNSKPLPFTGSVNPDGSIDRVDSGSIGFDGKATYVLGIKIVNTRGSTATPQDYNEVGSYTGTTATGVTLKPNDLSGGTSTAKFATVPVTFSGNTLSFSQEGKILTFARK